jgi:hypothetical protein
MTEIFPHIGHDLRRGPLVDLLLQGYVCLTCRVIGEISPWVLGDVTDWTEQDYYDNIDWIEGS